RDRARAESRAWEDLDDCPLGSWRVSWPAEPIRRHPLSLARHTSSDPARLPGGHRGIRGWRDHGRASSRVSSGGCAVSPRVLLDRARTRALEKLSASGGGMSITAQEALTRTIEHREIFHDEMLDLMRQSMSGGVSPVMIAAIVVGLRVKKETI